jgi:hypothetical protein
MPSCVNTVIVPITVACDQMLPYWGLMNCGYTEKTKRYAFGLRMQVTAPCRKATQDDRLRAAPTE